jgi:hypothetical protein
MKANRQATAQIKTCVDYALEEPNSHIRTFRGIKTGVVIVLILFWLPFIATYYLFGWLYLLAYGALLVVVISLLGVMSRCHRLLRSISHSKSSAEAFWS